MKADHNSKRLRSARRPHIMSEDVKADVPAQADMAKPADDRNRQSHDLSDRDLDSVAGGGRPDGRRGF